MEMKEFYKKGLGGSSSKNKNKKS